MFLKKNVLEIFFYEELHLLYMSIYYTQILVYSEYLLLIIIVFFPERIILTATFYQYFYYI